ncbi:TPR Domain containing protein, putative [Plasmodium gallinaceum]|uniref:TPR Domain containing protein, putative n=1 Tax=Plasmodium gallinaceum TaxID=5849 RepID=A0A1J1GSE8_PLAGA|nr:TPR Domain containing protein, putative [Plasmodium gallinaceum]CRG95348.1 TPR Domain containing protein, putative [Plasmodium gallinaceum]
MTSVKERYFRIPNDDEIDEFLEKVDNVTTKVRNILNDKISIEELEKEEKKLFLEKRVREIKEEEKKEKEKRDFIMGREGKGNENDYLYFCRFCFVEYNYHLKNCKRCNGVVITREQRKKELEEKVKIYKNEKDKRNIRRNNWEQFLKSKKNQEVRKITNYEKWDYYEPSSDTFDEDEKTLYVPKNNQNFQILEKKMNEDIKKRNENRKIAYNMKQKGNNFFRQKNYLYAIDCYKNALDICKDYLELYNNLSLCQIKIYQYENAIENCDKVIDYYNIFRNDLKIKNSVIFKSYARKGLALFKLHKFNESLENFKLALLLYPDDKETIEYIEKCEKILNDYQIVQNDEFYSNKNQENEKRKVEKKVEKNVEKKVEKNVEKKVEKKVEKNVEKKEHLEENKNNERYNIDSNDLNKENFEQLTMELLKIDIKKKPKVFSEYLRKMKKFLKKNKNAKLKFCSCIYEIKDRENEKIKKTTLLSYVVERLNDILFYIKKEVGDDILKNDNIKLENLHIPIYLKKCGNRIIDILIFILEDGYHYSDFCINALKPVLTFYSFKILKILKCTNFLLFISENYEARKLFYSIIESNNYVLKNILTTMNDYIKEQRSVYTKEKLLRFESLRSFISNGLNDDISEIIKEDNNKSFSIKENNKNESIINNNKFNDKKNYNERNDILKNTPTINLLYNKTEKKLEEKKSKKLIEKKYEFINLFGILSHFIVETNILNFLEKNFMKEIFNIIIFINEKFYDYNEMHCNYLSFLVNLVGNINIRLIFLNKCWSNIFYFVEHIENESLLKHILSVIFNLTIMWTNEMEKKKKVVSFDKEIKKSIFHKIIKHTQSVDKRVSELCFLLLSRFYLYVYYSFYYKDKNNNDSCNGNYDDNINDNNNDKKLINSLKKNIGKENEKLIQLDEFSILSLKKSILLTLSRKNEFSLIKSCISLVFSLSRYTNFLNILIEKDVNYIFKELTVKICSIFLDIQNNTTKDKSFYILINNIIMFFTQILKIILIKSDCNNIEIYNEIRKIIPSAIQIMNNVEKILKKNISIFLSYCFLNNHLKQTILSLYNNDINKIYYLLKVS